MQKIGKETQFVFDDYIVEDSENLKRRVRQPKRFAGNPLFKELAPAEEEHGPLGGSVLYDEEARVYRMYYGVFDRTAYFAWEEMGRTGIPNAKARGCYTLAYAESEDGIEWHRPELGLVEYHGDKHNNLMETGEVLAASPCVRELPPGKGFEHRFALTYTDQKMEPTPPLAELPQGALQLNIMAGHGLYLNFSDDGTHWKRHGTEPVLLGHSDTDNNWVYDARLGRFVLFMRPPAFAGRWKRRIARAESEDLIHWSRPSTVIVPDELDPTQFYGMTAWISHGVYFGCLQMYHDNEQTIDIQLAYSRDGVKWERLPHRPTFFPTGQEGAWDCGMVFPGAPIQAHDGTIRFYYSGGNAPHDSWEGKSNIGMATLSPDRFISRWAGSEEGVLLTRPLLLEGDRLLINAAAQFGHIAAEVLDADALRIEGYERDKCDAFHGDDLAHPLTWSGNEDLGPLRGRLVRLKFYLKHADLWTFRVVEDVRGP